MILDLEPTGGIRVTKGQSEPIWPPSRHAEQIKKTPRPPRQWRDRFTVLGALERRAVALSSRLLK